MLDGLDKKDWGACDEESVEEYLNFTKKFADDVKEASSQLAPG